MKKLSLLLILAITFAACGGGGDGEGPIEDISEGVETGTPQPLGATFLMMTAEDGQRYELQTNKDGNGFVARLGDDGNIVDKVTVSVSVGEDGGFEIPVTFPDGKVVTITGTVDTDGNVIASSVKINNVTVLEIIIVAVTDSSLEAPAYNLSVSSQTVTINNLGKCGDYTTDTGGAASFNEDITCVEEAHALIFSNITYDKGAIVSFDVTIDGVKYSYLRNVPGGGAAPDTTPPVLSINPAAGTYTEAVSVTITADELATIYYTTNGTNPTTSSSVYSSPINLVATTAIKYFGVDAAGNSSSVASAAYVITPMAEGVEINAAVSLSGVALNGTNLKVVSAGYLADPAQWNKGYVKFYKDDKLFYEAHGGGLGGTGIHLSVVDYVTGTIDENRYFDTYLDYNEWVSSNFRHEGLCNLATYLNGVAGGKVVMMGVADEAGFIFWADPNNSSDDYPWPNGLDPLTNQPSPLLPMEACVETAYRVIESLASVHIRDVTFRGSWAMIAVKE